MDADYDDEYHAYVNGLTAADAAELARVYRTMANDPELSRPTDLLTAAYCQSVADRKTRTP